MRPPAMYCARLWDGHEHIVTRADTWLMRMVWTGTDSARSALASRALSAAAMTVGMVTITNSVVSASRNSARASSMRACQVYVEGSDARQ